MVYAKNDTMFNESFATAVERLGGRTRLATAGSEEARQEYAPVRPARRNQFRALARATRKRLERGLRTQARATEREALKKAMRSSAAATRR